MMKLEDRIIDFLENNFDLNDMDIPDEYRYQSLPLCIMDAVFSIGVRYTSTANTVRRYCELFDLKMNRDCNGYPSIKEQHTISQFIENINNYTAERFAKNINKQRTSSRNGILKINAVLEWAEIFRKNGIETFQDYSEKFNLKIEQELKKVKGQNSGISIAYLKMLCGDENVLKPDRHILRFFESLADGAAFDAQEIIERVVGKLSETYSQITVRAIDYKIWRYMKEN